MSRGENKKIKIIFFEGEEERMVGRRMVFYRRDDPTGFK